MIDRGPADRVDRRRRRDGLGRRYGFTASAPDGTMIEGGARRRFGCDALRGARF
jgi:hypothetical protein